MTRPRILVTLDTGTSLRRKVPFADVRVKQAYVDAVERAGGIPLLVAPTADAAVRADFMSMMDGLVITGGAFDINPAKYGAQEQVKRVDANKPLRTDFEWHLLEHALDQGAPVLGICGGMQLLNVVLGGTLLQDIREQRPEAVEHEQPTSPADPAHGVDVVAGSPLARLTGRSRLEVNSTHHQAVDRLAPGMEAWGHAPDGIIEAIGLRDRPEVCGVQWHPELLADDASQALYAHLIAAASAL